MGLVVLVYFRFIACFVYCYLPLILSVLLILLFSVIFWLFYLLIISIGILVLLTVILLNVLFCLSLSWPLSEIRCPSLILLHGFSPDHNWLQMNGIICLMQPDAAMAPLIDYTRTCRVYLPLYFRFVNINRVFANGKGERRKELLAGHFPNIWSLGPRYFTLWPSGLWESLRGFASRRNGGEME